jgi:hypothetical protein
VRSSKNPTVGKSTKQKMTPKLKKQHRNTRSRMTVDRDRDEQSGYLHKPDSVNCLDFVFFTYSVALLRSGIMCVLIESNKITVDVDGGGSVPKVPAMVEKSDAKKAINKESVE